MTCQWDEHEVLQVESVVVKCKHIHDTYVTLDEYIIDMSSIYKRATRLRIIPTAS